jgi:putative methyltransferase (TIGR04325 family)
MNIKESTKMFIPPVFINLIMRLRSAQGRPLRRKLVVEWEYIPEGWAYVRTHPEVKGWNVQDILKVYKEKWPMYVAMVQGTGPLSIAHESTLTTTDDIISHNTIMSFAYALALVARHSDRLTMLDWGGGIGHYYLVARSLLPNVQIEYHCKDVPSLAQYGAQLFPDQHFYTDESCLEHTYDLVIASASLHYTEDWRGLLGGLARATKGFLYITGLPTVIDASSFVFIQRPYGYGYNTEYLGWCLNRKEFLKLAEATGLKLLREFIVGHRPVIHRAPEQNEYRGFLFSSASMGSL